VERPTEFVVPWGHAWRRSRAQTSAIIGIKLKEEERLEAGVSVGASGEWREGVGTRATLKAHPSAPPSPLRRGMSFLRVDVYLGR